MNLEPYIKYLQISVVILWAVAIGGVLYYFSGSVGDCPVSIEGRCGAAANLSVLSLHNQQDDSDFSLLKKP